MTYISKLKQGDPVKFRNPVGTLITGGTFQRLEGSSLIILWQNGMVNVTYTITPAQVVEPEQFNVYGVDRDLPAGVDWLDAVLARQRQQSEVFNYLGIETRYGATDGGDWLTIALQQRAAKVLRLAEAQSDGQDAAKQAA